MLTKMINNARIMFLEEEKCGKNVLMNSPKRIQIQIYPHKHHIIHSNYLLLSITLLNSALKHA